jgi:hypothetical protein
MQGKGEREFYSQISGKNHKPPRNERKERE